MNDPINIRGLPRRSTAHSKRTKIVSFKSHFDDKQGNNSVRKMMSKNEKVADVVIVIINWYQVIKTTTTWRISTTTTSFQDVSRQCNSGCKSLQGKSSCIINLKRLHSDSDRAISSQSKSNV